MMKISAISINHGYDQPAGWPSHHHRQSTKTLAFKAVGREAVPAAEILLIRAFPDPISYCILSHSVREIRVREESKAEGVDFTCSRRLMHD